MTDAAHPPLGADPPRRRATLAGTASVTGRGLHTGRRCAARLGPAPSGTGVTFRRTGPGGPDEAPARFERRVRQPLCTALRTDRGRLVRTVEHLLAALSAACVDDAAVELDGEELPIGDGSALPWLDALDRAGRRETEAPRAYLRVLKPVEVSRPDGRSLRAEPTGRDRLELDVTLRLKPPASWRWEGAAEPERVRRELAPARSFGEVHRAVAAMAWGRLTGRPILRGAGLGSTVAIWPGGRVLGGMRFPDEPVRHRALDLLGDLALAPAPILGRVVADRTGHDLNHALLARLLADRDAWRIETLP